MNQSQASDACARMAEAHAERAGEPEDRSWTHSRVHKAVFNQAFEFIPEEATWAVIDSENEPPKLVALDGRTLYTLMVGDLSNEFVGASTSCRFVALDPQRAAVECETKFIGHRTNNQPMGRETIWAFSLGDDSLTISTVTPPDRNRLSQDELFAQALASALGWETLPRETGIGRLEEAA